MLTILMLALSELKLQYRTFIRRYDDGKKCSGFAQYNPKYVVRLKAHQTAEDYYCR